jgi:transposase-like protein
MMLEMNNNPLDKAVDGDSKRARRASEESPSLPDPEVEVSVGRRRFTTQYKLSILAQADQCQHPGEIGALLRREGLYSSHLSTWRRLRREGVLHGLSPRQRGPKPDAAAVEQREIARLQKQVSKLEHELAKAHTIIDVQKKLSAILSTMPDDERSS